MNVAAGQQDEYRRRLTVVRTLMAAEGFDALVVADTDDIAVPPLGSCRYLSNFSGGRRRGIVVVVPAEGEPTLVATPGPLNSTARWAAARSWIQKVRSTPLPEWPPRADLLGDVVSVLVEAGLDRGRIGLCGHLIGQDALARRLPNARIEPAVVANARGMARDIVERARAIKSPWEMERIRAAQRYTDAGIQAFMAAAKPGVRHVAAVAEAEYTAKKLGAEETLTIFSAGTDPFVWDYYRGDLVFQEGDLVAVEFNARVDDGYVAQVARSGVIGTPTPLQQAVIETSRAATNAIIERIRPGVTGGQLWDVGLEVIQRSGLSPWGRFGHGMGISIGEAIDIMEGDDTVIEDGFCLEVHAGVWDPGTMNLALVGEQVLVVNGTIEILSQVPQDLGPLSAGLTPA